MEGTEAINRMPGGITTRKDLFGFADLIALDKSGGPPILIQVTSRSNVSARIKKIRTEGTGKGQHAVELAEIAEWWLRAGGRIFVEGWEKKGNRWGCREEEITLDRLTNG